MPEALSVAIPEQLMCAWQAVKEAEPAAQHAVSSAQAAQSPVYDAGGDKICLGTAVA